MITGEEVPDDGEVAVPRKLTIGYFRQDVEEMSGRSVLDEAIAGSGRAGALHHELEALQHAMGDPAQAGDMDRILARFGEVQEEYEHLGGYALESQTREVLHGLGFEDPAGRRRTWHRNAGPKRSRHRRCSGAGRCGAGGLARTEETRAAVRGPGAGAQAGRGPSGRAASGAERAGDVHGAPAGQGAIAAGATGVAEGGVLAAVQALAAGVADPGGPAPAAAGSQLAEPQSASDRQRGMQSPWSQVCSTRQAEAPRRCPGHSS